VGKPELDNLAKIGRLKAEPPSRVEFDGMLRSARGGLKDAQSEHIETDSRFVLATEAAHKFALAALRREGYRSENRITVGRRAGLTSAKCSLFVLSILPVEGRHPGGAVWKRQERCACGSSLPAGLPGRLGHRSMGTMTCAQGACWTTGR
jgi:hypothetical protein